MARCYVCRTDKPEAEFALDRGRKLGRKSLCKECDRAAARRYYAEHREEKLAKANARYARLRDARRNRVH